MKIAARSRRTGADSFCFCATAGGRYAGGHQRERRRSRDRARSRGGRGRVCSGLLDLCDRFRGRDGVSLSRVWSEGMRTYHGFLSHGFPNCFHMGLTQTGFTANFIDMLDEQSTHVARLIAQVRARNARAVEPTAEAEVGWVKRVTTSTVMTEYQNTCTTGLLQRRGDKQGTGLSPDQLPRWCGTFFRHARPLARTGGFCGSHCEVGRGMN